MGTVSVRGVSKSVGEGRAARRVLDRAELEIGAGEIVAIVGRSGSGKSTMLNLLGGLDRPDEGEIEVAGARVDRLSERELTRYRGRQVGFVFQLFHLIGELTAEQNVAMPARLATGARGNGNGNGSGAGGEIERVRTLLRRLGIDGIGAQLPHTLSGGEQQRVAIARALVNDPPLILADEPTGNLDSVAAAGVLSILRELSGEGRSVLLVTHDREAAAIADRTLVLEDGRLHG